jgi:hypothetical protein
MSCEYELFRAQGLVGADLYTELENVAITSLTGIVFRVRKPDRSELIKPIIIDDDAGGIFHLEWEPGDLDDAGDYNVDVAIESTPGDNQPIPVERTVVIHVRKSA